MARRALARKISYEQARSYQQTWPNPIGVTAIAAVNGAGSYRRRYQTTRKILDRPTPNPPTSELVREGEILSRKGMDSSMIAKAIEHRGNLGGWNKSQISKAVAELRARGVADGQSKRGSRKGSKKSSGKAQEDTVAKKTTKRPRRTSKKSTAKKRTTRKTAKKRTTRKTAKKRTTRKPTKATKAKARRAVKRVRPSARVDLSKATPAQTRKLAKVAEKQKKAVEAKKKAAKARREAAQATKAAKKTISKVAKRKPAAKKKTAKTRTKLTEAQKRARRAALRRKRKKTAQSRYLKGGRSYGGGKYRSAQAIIGPYNVRNTYKYTTSTGALSKIPIHALLGFESKRELNKHWGDGEYANDVATTIKGKKVTWDQLIRRRMDSIRRRRQRAADSILKRGGMFTPNKRRGRAKTRALTYEEWEKAMKKNARKRRRRKRKGVSAKQRAAARRNIKKAQMARRGRRSSKRKSTTRRPAVYRRNQAMRGSYVNQLKMALKLGLVITGGYAAHRVLSKLLAEAIMPDSQYKDLVGGGLVAAVGVPASVKFVPGDSKLVSAGMMVSLAQSVLVTLLDKVDDTGKYSGYLKGLGSYYQYMPGQMYPNMSTKGVGEYFRPGTSGLGRLTQAAAGMGQSRQLTQAAAGMGQPRLTQAAAGMGAQITQAAAGAGEYVAADLSGIGDYEEVIPEYTRPIPIDEGIAPDLTTAEEALSIAEGAAGVGGMGQYRSLPARSQVEPGGVWSPVAEAPNGSRRGTFDGKNGIFGS